MALIALVDMRDDNKAHKKRGDVICIKKEGEPWGSMETKYFVRIKIDDPDLEAQLLASDDPHPVITYPYGNIDTNEKTPSSTVLKKGSI